MKQEDKYLDYLFKSAREEEPQLSFEEVAEVFSASTSPTLLGLAKGWFLKNINLNSLLFLSATTLGFIAVFLFSSSNNSTQNESNENHIVTNQIFKSSTLKNIEDKKEADLTELSSLLIPEAEAAKNIKQSLILSNSKTTTQKNNKLTFQNFEKSLITESPIIQSINPELQLKKPQTIALSPTVKVTEKEKTFLGYQPKYETVDEPYSPWVVGEPSVMPWKITKQINVPILNDTERVLKQFMDTKYLGQIFEKEENGYFKPLNMVVYYSINENYFVRFKGQKVRLLNEKFAPDFDPNEPFIDVKRFKIKRSKAYFTFTYKDYHVQMQLRKVGEGWKRQKLKVKHNKDVKVNMTF